MFETTIENDWESATTWAEQEAISEKRKHIQFLF